MDKNEYNLKLTEIKKYVDQGDFTEAAVLADQVDWRRVRNVRTLCMISEVYEAVGRPEASKELLLRAYRRSPVVRSILYRLVEVTIQLKQFDEAIEYYTEYAQASPRDTNNYILKYKIYRGRGSSVDEQIAILREYLDQEYNEKYAYELAKLYQEADRIQDCLAECDDLVLWFQSGHYVLKALELKRRYAPLTAKQQQILELEREREAAEALRAQAIGQEKSIVEPQEVSEADNIMEDTAREIAEAVKETVAVDGMEAQEEADVTAGTAQATRVLGSQMQTEAEDAAQQGTSAPGATKAFDIEAIRRARALAALVQDDAAASETQEEAEADGQQEKGIAAEEVLPEAEEPEDASAEDTEAAGAGVDDAEPADAETVDSETADAEAAETEEAAEAEEPEPTPGPQVDYNPETLQNDILRSMKEITSGVGRRDMQDPQEALIDEVIEQSKQDQEMASAQRGMQDIRMRSQLQMPQTKEKTSAGRLSIDDVLLSMGEKGNAVREAAAKAEAATAKKEKVQGVLSAVDEALLGLGRGHKTEPDHVEEEAAAEKPVDTAEAEYEAVRTEEAPEEEKAVIQPEAEAATESAVATGEQAESQSEDETETDIDVTQTVEAQAEQPEKAGAKPDIEVMQTAEESEEEKAGSLSATESETGIDADTETEGEAAQTVEESAEEDIAAEALDAEMLDEPDDGGELPASQNMSMQEVAKANTRRMPTDEIEEELKSSGRRSARELAAKRRQQQEQMQADDEGENSESILPSSIRSYFRGFTEVRDLEMQIDYAMEQSLGKGGDKTSRTGNILIFGRHGSGKTQIAVSLAKALAREQGKEFVKMAKIYSTDLNRKDIAATIAKIAGGVLIIEEAGDLSDSTADQLTTALEFRTDGLIVIMEDEERYLRDLLLRHPRLTMKFTSQIYIPNYTLDELIGFAELIAEESECTLSAAGADVLAAKIEALLDKGDMVSLLTVRELVSHAVTRSGKLGRKLFGGKKRYDSQGRVILLDKDFR